MMGEEPLEVPPSIQQQQSGLLSHTPPTQQQHYRPQLQFQSPEHHPWLESPQQSERERALSRERIATAYERASTQQQSNAQVSAGKSSNPNTPRRTRHRVDAGEPRGCFNSSTSIPNSLTQSHWSSHHHHRNHFGNRFHQHFLPPPPQQNSFVNFPGSCGARSPPGGGEYYFQPMKMLSEFISSASAVAAAQAANHNDNSSPPRGGNSRENQLLLREMLCKSAAMGSTTQQSSSQSSSKLNNNNNHEYEDVNESNSNSSSKSLKSSKLDGVIGIMMDKLNSTPEPEVENASEQETAPLLCSANSDVVENNTMEETEHQSSTKVNSAAADLLNNNTSNSVTSGGQTRNKRKKYQPQRSDLVECSDLGGENIEFEEEMIKEEDEQEVEDAQERRVTRSQQRRVQNSEEVDLPENNSEGEDDDGCDEFTEIKPNVNPGSNRVKRKLPDEFLSDIDEDEAMLLRQVASGSRSSAATTNPDDAESMIQEYENEEEEQEAMINEDCQHDQDREQEIGSRRTLPVVRNLMRASQRVNPSVKEAPLTRQLLTSERPVSTPPTNNLEKNPSILRPSLNTQRHVSPNADLPNGLTSPANSFLNQWKENLKTTLMSHINELVDAQFSLLLGGGMIPPGTGIVLPPHLQQRILSTEHDRRSLRESNNPRSMQEPKVEQKRTPPPQQQQPQQNPPPRSHTPRDSSTQKPLMHLNGGSVLNTEKLSMMGSPPMNDIKKLPVGRATNSDRSSDYPGMPPRFPFMQNNERSMIPSGIQQNGKPSHFSSALVGLSNHHLQQQAVAAAVAANAVAAAAGIENMFDNDGALSLVVGNRGASGGNGPPGINDIGHGNVTPRKKRHKVTDTRLTPRAVSRLLGQVDTTPTSSTSPLYDHHGPSSSPQSSPHHHPATPIEPRSILQNGTPPPHRGDPQPRDRSTPQTNPDAPPRSIFNPFHPPGSASNSNPFFHPAALAAAAAGHAIHPSHLSRLDSPPMGTSLLHPALQNPSEYVERLREMSMERDSHQQDRNTRVGSDNVVVRDRGEHHHHASLREYPSVRGLRDRGTGGGGMMLSNDVLDLIGRAGSAGGSDSGGESGSGAFEMGGGAGGGMYCHTTSTLTPMHLRKAKLMFFWTRYPSSAVIKMYFPDIKFNKNNTAQLVKWFSNFREFYYIQMEKYARQALSEGVKQAEDLVVTTDSELYRVLNLHYNRNNHIEVPSNFRYVVEQTLREFFKSVQAGKDSEQSWKKAIYKIIARLDDPVPEYFKSPNFLEQLE